MGYNRIQLLCPASSVPTLGPDPDQRCILVHRTMQPWEHLQATSVSVELMNKNKYEICHDGIESVLFLCHFSFTELMVCFPQSTSLWGSTSTLGDIPHCHKALNTGETNFALSVAWIIKTPYCAVTFRQRHTSIFITTVQVRSLKTLSSNSFL